MNAQRAVVVSSALVAHRELNVIAGKAGHNLWVVAVAAHPALINVGMSGDVQPQEAWQSMFGAWSLHRQQLHQRRMCLEYEKIMR